MEINMTINRLLVEASPQFNMEGTNKIKLVGRNFEQAKRLLNVAEKKEIQKLKDGDQGLIKSQRGEDLLTDINIMAKVGHKMGSKYGADKVDSANEILGKLEAGFPDTKKELASDSFYRETKKAFNDKYERQNPGVETRADKAKKAEPEVEEPKPEPVAKQPEPEVVEPEAETETETETKEPEVKVSHPKSVEELQDLRDQTIRSLQTRVSKMKEDKSILGKKKAEKAQDVLEKYQKQMGKQIERFKLGPSHASSVANKVDSLSRNAENQVVQVGLTGAVGRTLKKGQEMGAALKQAAQKGAAKVGKALDDPHVQKVAKTIGEVKGKIKKKTEEKLGDIVDKGQEKAKARAEAGKETKPIKDIISKTKGKVTDVAGKAKETTQKVMSNIKSGVQDVTAKVKAKKESKPTMPPEGITVKPSTPEEERKEKARERIKRIAAGARKKVAGVKQIS
jgi:hypothetical protein